MGTIKASLLSIGNFLTSVLAVLRRSHLGFTNCEETRTVVKLKTRCFSGLPNPNEQPLSISVVLQAAVNLQAPAICLLGEYLEASVRCDLQSFVAPFKV